MGELVSIASVAVPIKASLYDSHRYRSTVLIAVALAALSGLAMWLFFGGTASSISGAPTYLFSIPSGAERRSSDYSLNGPLAVAVYEDRIAVADSGMGKVKTYSPNGKYLGAVDLTRLQNGRKKRAYPTGLAYDTQGRLFVVEVMRDRIYVFDAWLELVGWFPKEGDRGALVQPVALAVHGDELYVTDVGDSSIKVFSLDGTFVREFASRETRKVDLAYPNGVAVDSAGAVYVADSNNHKVIAFSPTGRELSTLNFDFSLPRGIAVDVLDRVHVADTFRREVVVFDRTGRLVASYGSAATNAGVRLEFPNGIAVDSERGRVYIADRGANRVQVWGWR